jgi:hypothetical protein
MIRMIPIIFLAAAAATPALAHAGDHSGRSLPDLLAHLMEWDHLAMIAGASAVTVLVVRRFRKSAGGGGKAR